MLSDLRGISEKFPNEGDFPNGLDKSVLISYYIMLLRRTTLHDLAPTFAGELRLFFIKQQPVHCSAVATTAALRLTARRSRLRANSSRLALAPPARSTTRAQHSVGPLSGHGRGRDQCCVRVVGGARFQAGNTALECTAVPA